MFSRQNYPVNERALWETNLREHKRDNVRKRAHIVSKPGYTLYVNPKSDDVERTPGVADGQSAMASTDLKRCVTLLTHMLETEGSVTGAPTRKKNMKGGAKFKKKVITPTGKQNNGVSKVGHARGSQSSKARSMRKDAKQKTSTGTATGQRAATGTATGKPLQREGNPRPAFQKETVHIPTGARFPMNSHMGDPRMHLANDISVASSGPVPYNNRLTSSTPDTTLFQTGSGGPLPYKPGVTKTGSGGPLPNKPGVAKTGSGVEFPSKLGVADASSGRSLPINTRIHTTSEGTLPCKADDITSRKPELIDTQLNPGLMNYIQEGATNSNPRNVLSERTDILTALNQIGASNLGPQALGTENLTNNAKPVLEKESKPRGVVAIPVGPDHCHRKGNAQLPLVLAHLDYSLTPGQSNPLNASDQVHATKPPQKVDPEPRLIKGTVDFQPNPDSWFRRTLATDLEPQRTAGAAFPTRTGTAPLTPFRAQIPSKSSSGLPYNVYTDPAEKENALDGNNLYTHLEDTSSGAPLVDGYSLYTNPEDVSSGIPHGEVPAGEFPGRYSQKYSQKVEIDKTEENYILDLEAAKQTRAAAEIMKVLSHPREQQQSKKSTEISSDSQTKDGSKVHQIRQTVNKLKAKRGAKEHARRSTHEKRKPHLRKPTRESPVKVPIKCDKSVQFTLADAGTQCSPDTNKPVMVSANTATETDLEPRPFDPQISQKSLWHMKILQRLLGELKSMVSTEKDVDLHSLVTQVEQTAAMFVPGLGGVDWQTELELAMQPLRSENSQLRRKLRIANQHLRDHESKQESDDKPDPSFNIVHLELQKRALEQELHEVRTARDQARDRLRAIQTQTNQLQHEKHQLMAMLSSKDSERKMRDQDWISETQRLQENVRRQQDDANTAMRERDTLQHQIHITRLSLDQRDTEIQRLRALVRDLQGSMKRLLNQLQILSPARGPPPSRMIQTQGPLPSSPLADRQHRQTVTDKQPHTLEEGATLISDVDGAHADSTVLPATTISSHHSPMSSAPSSARRALPFSTHRLGTPDVATPDLSQHTITELSQHNITSSPKSRTDQSDSGYYGPKMRATASESESGAPQGPNIGSLDPGGHQPRPGADTRYQDSEARRMAGIQDSDEFGPVIDDTPIGADGIHQGHSVQNNGGKLSDLWTEGELDSTDYFMVPGSSPIKRAVHAAVGALVGSGRSSLGRGSNTDSETPTVGELLTPLKDRMQNQYKRLSLENHVQEAGKKNVIEVVTEEDSLEFEPLEIDSTLLGSIDTTSFSNADDTYPPQGPTDNDPRIHDTDDLVAYQDTSKSVLPADEESRYSMTDYFTKYGDPTGKTRGNSRFQPAEDILEHDETQDPLLSPTPNSRHATRDQSGRDVFDVQMSLQESLYKGTELDVSISSIDDGSNLVSMSTVTASSMASVDDSAFRQGLADLDANIARIQQQLQANLGRIA